MYHVSAVCKGCFFHIRALRHKRPLMSTETAKMVTCAIFSSRLDYCNSVLAECKKWTNWSELSAHWHVWLLVWPHILETIWHQFSPSYIGCLIGLRYNSRSPWWCSRSARQSSHYGWRNWSTMLFHSGPCDIYILSMQGFESQKLCWSLVPELIATLQTKRGILCQTLLG